MSVQPTIHVLHGEDVLGLGVVHVLRDVLCPVGLQCKAPVALHGLVVADHGLQHTATCTAHQTRDYTKIFTMKIFSVKVIYS